MIHLFGGKNQKELNISDYKNIWSKFCFLDESGSLTNPTTPLFTIGIIKCSQPYYIYNRLAYERKKKQFYDEMKFNKLSKNNLDFAKLAIDTFFATRSVYFYSYTIDKEGPYFKKEFQDNPWMAYQNISIRLLEAAISPNEILIVIADNMDVADNVKFEVSVKNIINEQLSRLAIAGVCRFDSKSNDLLQLVDLIIGAINYDLKISAKLSLKTDPHKKELADHLKRNLGAINFIDGFRNYTFNIFVDKDIKRRLTPSDGK